MKHVLVVGGGLAGLTSAFYLSKKFHVTLIEATSKLGGRAYSLKNINNNDFFDNGQHIMMSCYKETIELLKNIGSLDKVDIQKKLFIPFVDEDGTTYSLSADKLFYPLNQLFAILNYKAISLKDRLKIIDFILDLSCCFKEDITNLSVLEWLILKNQSDDAVNKLWEILIVGTMNTSPDKASAEIFYNVLKEVFLTGANGSKIVLPKVGLSELFCSPIKEALEKEKQEIIFNETVQKIITNKNKITSVITNKNQYSNFDYCVFAIPPHALSKIEFIDEAQNSNNPSFKLLANNFQYSSILNIHLWLRENVFKERFYGLLNSEIHWLFNHGSHISLTKSYADKMIKLDNQSLIEEIYSELRIYFPIFNKENVIDVKIIKEKRATFIPDVASNSLRKNIKSNFENLFFAGDWTDTDLPATIEGAILSGVKTAQNILSINE